MLFLTPEGVQMRKAYVSTAEANKAWLFQMWPVYPQDFAILKFPKGQISASVCIFPNVTKLCERYDHTWQKIQNSMHVF